MKRERNPGPPKVGCSVLRYRRVLAGAPGFRVGFIQATNL